LIDLCSLKYEPVLPFDGVSLKPLILENKELPERTIVVHDQGRFGEPVGEGLLIKYKDFAVMKSNWRLVGSELYDLKTDPGLKSNVATKHQELVQQLKTDYESWWTAISEKANGNTPFVINPDKQKEVVISS